MATPFHQEELRDWFFSGMTLGENVEIPIFTHGSGPFEEYEFDGFLRGFGIQIIGPSEDLEVLVVGREDWDSDKIQEVIEARRGKQLRIYSQEMFLALLASGNDPLDSPNIATVFGEEHPALQYIQDWGFDWPNAKQPVVFGSSGAIEADDWKIESFLKFMGYTAGAKGRDRNARRAALRMAFLENPSYVPDAQYLRVWGEPESATRLRKIAERLEININLRIDVPKMREAVSHWREDLAWLKAEFYDGRYTFPWPSPTVR